LPSGGNPAIADGFRGEGGGPLNTKENLRPSTHQILVMAGGMLYGWLSVLNCQAT
jgi:hypothetical protein